MDICCATAPVVAGAMIKRWNIRPNERKRIFQPLKTRNNLLLQPIMSLPCCNQRTKKWPLSLRSNSGRTTAVKGSPRCAGFCTSALGRGGKAAGRTTRTQRWQSADGRILNAVLTDGLPAVGAAWLHRLWDLAHTGRVYHPNNSACAALCPNATIRIARQLSTKVASLCARAEWRSFSSAFASI